jgi:hypothetical protein
MAATFGPPLPPRTLRAHRVRRGRLTTRQFNKALSDWALTAIPAHVKQVTQWLALEALTRIVGRTPVDTGRARGGWFVTIGAPSNAPTNATDPNGGAVVGAGAATIVNAPVNSIIWIQNNVDYIRILEEGGFVPTDPGPSSDPRKGRTGRTLVSGGYSVQAPQGMVAVTLQELMGVFIK